MGSEDEARGVPAKSAASSKRKGTEERTGNATAEVEAFLEEEKRRKRGSRWRWWNKAGCFDTDVFKVATYIYLALLLPLYLCTYAGTYLPSSSCINEGTALLGTY